MELSLNENKLVYFIVGEPSGDLLASRLMKSLLEKVDDKVSFTGLGGESMSSLGFKSLFDISDTALMGLAEVLPRLKMLIGRINEIVDDIVEKKPDIIISVDSWGLVKAVLKRIKKRNVKVPKLHYVAPMVWAWKKKRAKTLHGYIDRLMTILPYEPGYFEPYGLSTDFVGHPVLETMNVDTEETPEEFKQRNGIPLGRPLLCVLPGSRTSETEKLIPIFKESIAMLQKKIPDLCVILPTVNTVAKQVSDAFFDLEIPHKVIYGQTERYNAFRASDAAMAASGTVTLELAITKTPHIIAYTFNSVTNLMARLLVKIRFANIINILGGREIIPEFLLNRCRPDLIVEKVYELLTNKEVAAEEVREAREQLEKLRYKDERPSDRAADIVLEMLQ